MRLKIQWATCENYMNGSHSVLYLAVFPNMNLGLCTGGCIIRIIK